jgi:hypothetical protein
MPGVMTFLSLMIVTRIAAAIVGGAATQVEAYDCAKGGEAVAIEWRGAWLERWEDSPSKTMIGLEFRPTGGPCV